MNKLVAYFSVSGVTRKLAEDLANLEQADLVEIEPEQLYTKEDLDYTKKESRSSIEMADLTSRPAIKSSNLDMNKYDVVFVGFPIWWGREPSVVDTFLDDYNFEGKKIIPFCTSGGSDVDAASERIASLTNASVDRGLRLGGNYNKEDLKLWTDGLELL